MLTKKTTSIIISLIIYVVGFGQENINYYDHVGNIVQDLNNNSPYKAIKKMDELAEIYFAEEDIFYNRGLVKYYLRDVHGAREDFNKCIELGYKINKWWLKAVISDQFLVDIFTEGYFETGQLLPENGYKKIYSLKDSLQGALRPERTCFDIYYYDLSVKLFPKKKSIEGINSIYFKTIENTDKIQIDLSDNYVINSIKMGEKSLRFDRIYNAVFIHFDYVLQQNDDYCITISYKGHPREAPEPPWNGGFVWEKKKFN